MAMVAGRKSALSGDNLGAQWQARGMSVAMLLKRYMHCSL